MLTKTVSIHTFIAGKLIVIQNISIRHLFHENTHFAHLFLHSQHIERLRQSKKQTTQITPPS